MKISIVGTGYVGVVQGACFADTSNNVICMDVDEKKINELKRGVIPIYEPGLEELVRRNAQNRRLEFTTNLKFTVEKSKIIFLCLPAPQSEDGAADLSHILTVVEHIADYINEEKFVISKSTVPVGTVDKIKHIFREKSKHEVEVISNPELLACGKSRAEAR